MNRIRVTANAQHPYGLITDADTGELVHQLDAATVHMHATRPPMAQLNVLVVEVDATVAIEDVQWFGLDRVPIEALQAELARRAAHPPEVTG